MDEAANLLNSYQMLCGDIGAGVLWNSQEIKGMTISSQSTTTTTATTSVSTVRESMQQLVDSVDSALSWGGFDCLEEELFFFHNSQS